MPHQKNPPPGIKPGDEQKPTERTAKNSRAGGFSIAYSAWAWQVQEESEPAMRHRLNVTEHERLCYSRRKLQAISALRTSGVNPSLFGLHKEYRVPGVRGKVYLVEHPTGDIYHFASLKEIHLYVAEYQAWQTQTAFDWDEWRYAPAYRATWQHMLTRLGRARLQCFPAS